MPRRFFRKFALKRHQLAEQKLLAPFGHLLHDQRLWGVRRKSVVRGIAWGVFVAFLPLPGHVLIAALGSLVLRCNIPLAVLATFISNPLTIGPIFYFAYRLGAALLGIEPGPFEIDLSLDWLGSAVASIWQPLLLGSVILGLCCALLTYLVLGLIWRFSVADYKARKRQGRRH